MNNSLPVNQNACAYPDTEVQACPITLSDPIIFGELFEIMIIVSVVGALVAWLVQNVIDAVIKIDEEKYEPMFSSVKKVIMIIYVLSILLFITGIIFYLVHRRIKQNSSL